MNPPSTTAIIIHSLLSILLYTPVLLVFDNKLNKVNGWAKIALFIVNMAGIIFWILVSIVLSLVCGNNEKKFDRIKEWLRKIYFN